MAYVTVPKDLNRQTNRLKPDQTSADLFQRVQDSSVSRPTY